MSKTDDRYPCTGDDAIRIFESNENIAEIPISPMQIELNPFNKMYFISNSLDTT